MCSEKSSLCSCPSAPQFLAKQQPMLMVSCIFLQKIFMHIQANKYYMCFIFCPFFNLNNALCIINVPYFFIYFTSSILLCEVFTHDSLWLHNTPLYSVPFHQSFPFGHLGFFLIFIKGIVQWIAIHFPFFHIC